jgi:putative hydrolase of the HAD superfamily
MRLAALGFDATGTLIETAEPVGEVYQRVASEHGVDLPAWRLDDAFRRILRRAPPRGLAGGTPEARAEGEIAWWVERIRQTFQATDSTARFADFPAFAAALFEHYRRAEAWRVRPGVPGMLAALRRRGWPLGIVSNFDHRLLEILQAIDLASHFDSVTLPIQCGVSKPDRGIFAAAAEALGCPIEELGYVGDDAPGILEAIRGLGLHVFDVRDIPSWDAFPDWLERTATLVDERE